jgi:hypothetical protein
MKGRSQPRYRSYVNLFLPTKFFRDEEVVLFGGGTR